MRTICVARHRFLSEHFCRYFDGLGVDTMPCVGLKEAAAAARAQNPDAMICDYDLLTTRSATQWKTDLSLSNVPIIAVSLTRDPGDAHLLDMSGITGFL